MRPWPRLQHSVSRAVLVVLLLTAWCARPQLVLAQSGTAGQPAGPGAAELEKLSTEVDHVFDALTDIHKQIPDDTFDAKEIADRAGRVPSKLLEWVRDQTFWVPYRGALRGPCGVLQDRVGNSLDRALLLAELLRATGATVRLAHTEFAEAQAAQLLAKVRPLPADLSSLTGAAAGNEDQVEQLVQRCTSQHGVDGAKLRDALQQATLRDQRVAEDLTQRVSEIAPALLALVGPPQQVAGAAAAPDQSAAIAALRDHWWVQRQEGNSWTDLDPLLPDAQPGASAIGQAADGRVEFLTADARSGSFDLGSNAHEVEIRIVVEQKSPAGLREGVLLTHVERPHVGPPRQLTLRHIPVNWPRDVDLAAEKEPNAKLRGIILDQNEWIPVLITAGGGQDLGSGVSSGGNVDPQAAQRLSSMLDGAQVGRGVGGILRGGAIGDRGAPRKRPGAADSGDAWFSAEWIEYVVKIPGRPAQTVRRQIFDLIGPAQRAAAGKEAPAQPTEVARLDRGLAMLAQTDILVTGSRLSSPFVAHERVATLLRNRGVLSALVREAAAAAATPSPAPQDRKALQKHMGEMEPMPGPVFDLALARSAWSNQRDNPYHDSPNVLAYHTYAKAVGAGQFALCNAFDVVRNDLAARRSAPARDAFAVRLEQSVLETCAEDLLPAGCSGGGSGGGGGAAAAVNLHALARQQGVQWRAIRAGDESALAQCDLPADTQARIRQALSGGCSVVAPSKAVLFEGQPVVRWWQVDSSTGCAVAIGDRGWGQTATEKPTITSKAAIGIWMAMLCFLMIGTLAGNENVGRAIGNQRWDGLTCGMAALGGILFAGSIAQLVYTILAAGILGGASYHRG